MIQLAVVLFGLIIGSFLTGCIYRIPYGREKGPGEFWQPDEGEAQNAPEAQPNEGEAQDGPDAQPDEEPVSEESGERMSVLFPARSFCPECRTQLPWRHNIPVFSWLMLGGRCHACRKPISLRYPAVELLTAIAALLSYQQYPPLTAVLVFVFCCALIVISFIDCEYYIIPNVITMPGMALGVLLGALNQYYPLFAAPVTDGLLTSFWGLLAGGGFLFFISETYYLVRRKVGLGFGDVKLLAVVGLWFGPEASIYTIFFGSFAGAILGALILVLLRQKMSRPLPFGPYLAFGTVLYFFAGASLPQRLIQGIAALFIQV